MVSTLSSVRLIAFAGIILCALISLALGAHITNISTTNLGGYFTFAALTIAVSVLTLLTLPAMVVIDNARKGAATSYIIVEVAWLGVLGVLWLAAAALASQAGSGSPASCSWPASRYYRLPSYLGTVCREIKSIQAFTYLAWLASWGYAGVLAGSAIMLANRGYNGVWTQSVKDTDFNAPAQNATQAGIAYPQQPQMQPIQQVYPGVTPQVVSQPGSYVGSPAFGQPAPGQHPQQLSA